MHFIFDKLSFIKNVLVRELLIASILFFLLSLLDILIRIIWTFIASGNINYQIAKKAVLDFLTFQGGYTSFRYSSLAIAIIFLVCGIIVWLVDLFKSK